MGVNDESLQVVIDRGDNGKLTNIITLPYILSSSTCGVVTTGLTTDRLIKMLINYLTYYTTCFTIPTFNRRIYIYIRTYGVQLL